MKKNKSLLALAIPVAVVAIAIVMIIIHKSEPQERIIVGTFEAPSVDVSSEIPGRIDSIYVQLGDTVQKGQILATLESNIMNAKLTQAKGVRESAEGLMKKIESGTRKELINEARNQYLMTQSQYDFVDKTYKRYKVLYADSIISKQEMDRLDFKHSAAKNQMEAAKSNYEMAKIGATKEDFEIVRGKLESARGVFDETHAYYNQLILKAPVSGEISEKIGAEGEVMRAGYPILTVLQSSEIYAVIDVREDLLNKFQKGSLLKGKVPGMGGKTYTFKVSYMAPMASFADWVPTHAKGDFELKTFEIRLHPVKPIHGLRPGMTVQLKY
ncbi:MAG: efflux RND transporter periplasmic adaptor subunit [Bacteroidales bacterium]|nr:efflux RND transporter periplasmic adaptor subunit [Bacteroidales bacterium]